MNPPPNYSRADYEEAHYVNLAGEQYIGFVSKQFGCELLDEIATLKYELACVKFQRDALLEITWLDLPAEPDEESTKEWRRLFNEGWERKDDSPRINAAELESDYQAQLAEDIREHQAEVFKGVTQP